MSRRAQKLKIVAASDADAAVIAALRTAAAEHLTATHGRGHWSSGISEKAVLGGLPPSKGRRTAEILIARRGRLIVGTARLQTKKPWAIDASYFTAAQRPLYLIDMAVAPENQRQGIGRAIVEALKSVAREWPSDALRLDAYDHPAGAGAFYAKCGFREVGRAMYRGTPHIYYEWVPE